MWMKLIQENINWIEVEKFRKVCEFNKQLLAIIKKFVNFASEAVFDPIIVLKCDLTWKKSYN